MPDAPDEQLLLTLLGVDRTTPWPQVRRAFRDAVWASHPDLNRGDPDAEQRLKLLNGLWESINTPAKWAWFVAQPSARENDAGRRRPSSPASAVLGHLRVQRQRSGSAGMRRWGLELDGELIGTIANGATGLFQARPGRHSVRVFYDWYGSDPLTVELRAGHELHLGCRQQANAFRSLTSPKRSLTLELLGSRRVA